MICQPTKSTVFRTNKVKDLFFILNMQYVAPLSRLNASLLCILIKTTHAKSFKSYIKIKCKTKNILLERVE